MTVRLLQPAIFFRVLKDLQRKETIMTTTNTPRQDIYSRITDQIIGALETGVKATCLPARYTVSPKVA